MQVTEFFIVEQGEIKKSMNKKEREGRKPDAVPVLQH
jgi:hypothetical protein